MNAFQGKTVVITGGTTGIGLETARLFIAEGAHVTVTGTNPTNIDEARRLLNGQAEVVVSDASSAKDIEALAGRFAEKSVDLLFLNAGIAKFGAITELDAAAFEQTFHVNVLGPWLAMKHFASRLRQGGSIVVTTSVNGEIGMPGSSAYASSKAAMRSIVRVAAAEFAGEGIRVNAVSPGPITTPLYGKLGMPAEAVKGFSESLIAQIPLRRFGTSEEIAKAVLFLAKDATFMTGEEIVIDGGMTRV
jgi:NAD(P)-dependent dehydrogenase (short-subunit alcohol dehydrogenase family)